CSIHFIAFDGSGYWKVLLPAYSNSSPKTSFFNQSFCLFLKISVVLFLSASLIYIPASCPIDAGSAEILPDKEALKTTFFVLLTRFCTSRILFLATGDDAHGSF